MPIKTPFKGKLLKSYLSTLDKDHPQYFSYNGKTLRIVKPNDSIKVKHIGRIDQIGLIPGDPFKAVYMLRGGGVDMVLISHESLSVAAISGESFSTRFHYRLGFPVEDPVEGLSKIIEYVDSHTPYVQGFIGIDRLKLACERLLKRERSAHDILDATYHK